MKRYVLGFMMDTLGRVVLIRKNRPAWQAGALNGVGGKLEHPAEPPASAMSREFFEETGVVTPPALWRPLATLSGPLYEVTVFMAYSQRYTELARTMTDETVEIHHVDSLPQLTLLPTVHYLILMARDDSLHLPIALSYDQFDPDLRDSVLNP